jgi:mono/diheme cytochrome c family protein
VKALTVGLATALVASIALNLALRGGTYTRPVVEYFPDMVRSPRYNAFEANPHFADGMTLRVPPAGTIARGMLPLSSRPATSPGSDGTNPFSANDAAAVERGATMFGTYCVPCHGATGQGDGRVVAHGFPAPPSLLSESTRAMSDAEVFDAITSGLGTMPSYGPQIAGEDRWKTILHLRRLQQQAPTPRAAP